jgi:hypothetical protein
MKIFLTRDSVAMGDDMIAHDLHTEIEAEAVEEVLRWVQTSGYLPTIAGGQATWSAASNLPIAVLVQQWSSPRLLLSPGMYRKDFNYEGDSLKIHFNYHAQMAPETVVEVLRCYRNK